MFHRCSYGKYDNFWPVATMAGYVPEEGDDWYEYYKNFDIYEVVDNAASRGWLDWVEHEWWPEQLAIAIQLKKDADEAIKTNREREVKSND